MRRRSKIPKARRDRRNKVEAADKVLEYDVYGLFKVDDGRPDEGELDRKWCCVAELATADPDWADKVKEWEDDAMEAREDEEEHFS